MEAKELERLRAELAEFLGVMTEGMGRMERCRAMQSYVTGLLLDGERKSIQPMAVRLVESKFPTRAIVGAAPPTTERDDIKSLLGIPR